MAKRVKILPHLTTSTKKLNENAKKLFLSFAFFEFIFSFCFIFFLSSSKGSRLLLGSWLDSFGGFPRLCFVEFLRRLFLSLGRLNSSQTFPTDRKLCSCVLPATENATKISQQFHVQSANEAANTHTILLLNGQLLLKFFVK